MASNNDNELGKGFKLLQVFWPVALAFATVAVAGVRADAQLVEVGKKVDYLYGNGAPSVAARLARMEERQLVLIETINRMDSKLDAMNTGGTEYGRHNR